MTETTIIRHFPDSPTKYPPAAKLSITELNKIALKLRGTVLRMSHFGRAPHLGSALSCIDILTSLYWDVMDVDPSNPSGDDRDRLILSKGHAAAALYASLALRGFFKPDLLETYNQPGGSLAEHPGPWCVPGIEAATGSLGHGLSLGLGMALAAGILQKSYRVYVVMSDGECNEGSVWEAAMMAPVHKLGNLTVVIDYNKWQATGRSEEVLGLKPLREKWKAFGWHAVETDGHDIAQLAEVLGQCRERTDQPSAVIAHTVKGKGISFMEDDNNWHYRIPSRDELIDAEIELGL